MTYLRTYLLVGGMPQSVIAYVERKDFREIDAIKRNILTLYRNDISKYAGRNAPKVTRIFDSIPGLLQQHEKRFRPTLVKTGARMREFDEPLFWLDESRVVNFCYNATEPNVGLALSRDNSKVKLYISDTGLLLSMAFSEGELEQDAIYSKILHGKLEFNKGMIVENLVAQLLISAGHPLYFYSRSSRDDAAERMEIDFLVRKREITSRHNILPIEVKSTSRYSLTSLKKFENKFKNYLAGAIVFHTGDFGQTDRVTYLPLYMAGLI